MKFRSQNDEIVKIYAKTLENEAFEQIQEMSDSAIGEKAHIRIMPDAHAGTGCTIGTTMYYIDKVCPNIVGVDIGCGVTLAKLNKKIGCAALDRAIRTSVPYGRDINTKIYSATEYLKNMRCWNKLSAEVQDTALHSCGTLGGGNHFIEMYDDNYISVHSGSRNIGYKVAKYYQSIAEKKCKNYTIENLLSVEPQYRQEYINVMKTLAEYDNKDLAYITGQDLENYLYDMDILRTFAYDNRVTIIGEILHYLGYSINVITEIINSTHNYIDTQNKIIRKGAIQAIKNQSLVIPLNMRDGIIIGRGKGNKEWNYSAPHGAGRLYSRNAARANFNLCDYQKAMSGIYTTCINKNTIDEAPFAYKDAKEIVKAIKPTVKIDKILKPIYNFKSDTDFTKSLLYNKCVK